MTEHKKFEADCDLANVVFFENKLLRGPLNGLNFCVETNIDLIDFIKYLFMFSLNVEKVRPAFLEITYR